MLEKKEEIPPQKKIKPEAAVHLITGRGCLTPQKHTVCRQTV